MFDNQVTTLTTILKNKDIQEYAGDAFWNIIKAVSLGDISSLIDTTTDIKKLLFHVPTVLFWDKMQRYMFGTFMNYDEQRKMAGKFSIVNNEYEIFVKRQIHLINEINDDKKIDYFANLTRCYLLTEMKDSLYYKLARFLTMCTIDELDFIASFDYNGTTFLSAMVSSLYQYGLFDQQESLTGGIDYALSGFGKALKSNCLNFDENQTEIVPKLSYEQIAPLNISEPMTFEDLDKVLGKDEIVLDCNGNSK